MLQTDFAGLIRGTDFCGYLKRLQETSFEPSQGRVDRGGGGQTYSAKIKEHPASCRFIASELLLGCGSA